MCIRDRYNDFFEKICAGKFPRGIRMRYDWAWCACTWSALAAALRYESIMPMEISCYYLIEAAKKMGCWQENDAYAVSYTHLTRELKGRSTTSLNDDGKKIWSYTKNNIKSEKAAKVKEEQEKRDQKITELREKAEATKEHRLAALIRNCCMI